MHSHVVVTFNCSLTFRPFPHFPPELLDNIIVEAWRSIPRMHTKSPCSEETFAEPPAWQLYDALSLVSRQWRDIIRSVMLRYVYIQNCCDLDIYRYHISQTHCIPPFARELTVVFLPFPERT